MREGAREKFHIGQGYNFPSLKCKKYLSIFRKCKGYREALSTVEDARCILRTYSRVCSTQVRVYARSPQLEMYNVRGGGQKVCIAGCAVLIFSVPILTISGLHLIK